MKGKAHEQELAPSKTPSRKCAVVFSKSIHGCGNMDDNMSLPTTPTKQHRIDSPANVTGWATSPRKRTTRATDKDTAMAAFHAAITSQILHGSSPARPAQPVPSLLHLLNTLTTSPDDADPSTPRRPRTLRPSTSTMNVGSPAKSSVIATPTCSALQASTSVHPWQRYYPVFLGQQQWLSQDQRVEWIWADAATHCSKMVELYGHTLERYRSMLA